jgi:hypothetical protein
MLEINAFTFGKAANKVRPSASKFAETPADRSSYRLISFFKVNHYQTIFAQKLIPP